MKKVRIETVPLDPNAPLVLPDRINVALVDGRRLTRKLGHPLGHPSRPISRETLRMKFFECVEGRFPTAQASKLFESLQSLEHLRSVRDIPVSDAGPTDEVA
jgi:2-methylcitrate dehydratase PrpD